MSKKKISSITLLAPPFFTEFRSRTDRLGPICTIYTIDTCTIHVNPKCPPTSFHFPCKKTQPRPRIQQNKKRDGNYTTPPFLKGPKRAYPVYGGGGRTSNTLFPGKPRKNTRIFFFIKKVYFFWGMQSSFCDAS